MDTIFALASGKLPAGIAIVRISGQQCNLISSRLLNSPIEPGHFSLREIVDWPGGEIIDQAMVYFAPGPNSFTGEDVLEFHLHGSPVILQRVYSLLGKFDHVRLARAGEFTQRAFENERLDLSEVQGLRDLLEAETENQRVQAMARYRGGVSKLVENWRTVLVNELAQVEAVLDFSDEEDVGLYDSTRASNELFELSSEIDQALQGYESGRIVRDGFRVAVAGLPNVGKSSIINALTGTDRSIVTASAGTTRDVQEVHLELNGQLFILFDSAGIRTGSDEAECEGIRRALELLDLCDLVLWVSAPDIPLSEIVPSFSAPYRRLSNKSDIEMVSGFDLNLSATSKNMDDLKRFLLGMVEGLSQNTDSVLISRVRDQSALVDGNAEIQAALDLLGTQKEDADLVLVAEHLRRTMFFLNRLLGKVDSEEILGQVFSGFCIGK